MPPLEKWGNPYPERTVLYCFEQVDRSEKCQSRLLEMEKWASEHCESSVDFFQATTFGDEFYTQEHEDMRKELVEEGMLHTCPSQIITGMKAFSGDKGYQHKVAEFIDKRKRGQWVAFESKKDAMFFKLRWL